MVFVWYPMMCVDMRWDESKNYKSRRKLGCSNPVEYLFVPSPPPPRLRQISPIVQSRLDILACVIGVIRLLRGHWVSSILFGFFYKQRKMLHNILIQSGLWKYFFFQISIKIHNIIIFGFFFEKYVNFSNLP